VNVQDKALPQPYEPRTKKIMPITPTAQYEGPNPTSTSRYMDRGTIKAEKLKPQRKTSNDGRSLGDRLYLLLQDTSYEIKDRLSPWYKNVTRQISFKSDHIKRYFSVQSAGPLYIKKSSQTTTMLIFIVISLLIIGFIAILSPAKQHH